MEGVLSTLEFNAKRHPDRLTGAIMGQAARELRSLRSRVVSLEGDLVASRSDVRGLEGSLARLIVQVYEDSQP